MSLGVDLTIEERATGSDVVRASVAKIESSVYSSRTSASCEGLPTSSRETGKISPSQSVEEYGILLVHYK